jgi:hypothetical protein
MVQLTLRLCLLTLGCILLFSTPSRSQVSEFGAKNDGNDVLIFWRTGDESTVKEFQIYRRAAAASDFAQTPIGNVEAKRQNSSTYTFRDLNAFGKVTSFYFYRLVIVYTDNTTRVYANDAGIDHGEVSGVRRTWGSIKAMFRF